MKKSEQLSSAMTQLAVLEEIMDKFIQSGDFASAAHAQAKLSGALYILRNLGLLPESVAKARDAEAFERYISAKYPPQEEAKAP